LRTLICEKNSFFEWALICELRDYAILDNSNTTRQPKIATSYRSRNRLKAAMDTLRWSDLMNSAHATGFERLLAEFLLQLDLNLVKLREISYQEALPILKLILQQDLAYSC
jgi:hypothetical protein